MSVLEVYDWLDMLYGCDWLDMFEGWDWLDMFEGWDWLDMFVAKGCDWLGFYDARGQWLPTWLHNDTKDTTAFEIDDIKVWAISNQSKWAYHSAFDSGVPASTNVDLALRPVSLRSAHTTPLSTLSWCSFSSSVETIGPLRASILWCLCHGRYFEVVVDIIYIYIYMCVDNS